MGLKKSVSEGRKKQLKEARLNRHNNKENTAWRRFTSEFAPGGLIDSATPDQLALAWMPATNDHNEGTLGALRVRFREAACLTLHQFNAGSTYHWNNTQVFMDALMQADDHEYIMRKAREVDSSGLEAKQRKEQVEHDLRLAQSKRDKDADKKRQQLATIRAALEFCQSKLISHENQVKTLIVKEMDLQLDLFQKYSGDTDLPKTKKDWGNRNNKEILLRASLKRYQDWIDGGGATIQQSILKSLSELEKLDEPEDGDIEDTWEEVEMAIEI
ncbi:hypothetical protein BJ912DRAFT_1149083 [Pholiota molesta]|nr:hypothetical protein BJ912DRAFT_1149083 [Pholiota molesta]